MIKFRFAFRAIALLVFAFATTSFVNAQATRTWVSGVGDDANPCSRTAPCKTFAGAISKTATGGEIDALDPGGFGAVTITKSITLNGGGGQGFASILVSVGNGVNVNAAGATVTLRRVEINGVGLGGRGVNATAVGNLNIEDCRIFGFQSEGVFVNLGTGANVNINDSIIRGNGLSGTAGAGAGVRTTTSDATFGTGHTIFLTVSNTHCDNNNEGFRVENNVRATISNSTGSNNVINGFDCFPGAAASEINLESSVAAGNKQFGIFAGPSGTVRISNVTVTNNLTQGVNAAGGSILTYSNNKIQGNGPTGTTNGSTTGGAPQG
jgi:hypothetical protein